MTAVIHIAGMKVHIGPYLRQRCAWCGAVLIDYDLRNIAVPVGMDPNPSTWPVADLVAVDGNASYVVAHVEGDELPDGACARLDPAVTA
jgi:hypothetical protein